MTEALGPRDPRRPSAVRGGLSRNLAYIDVREGAVARTIEAEEDIWLDVDEHGRLLGIELASEEAGGLLRDAVDRYLADVLPDPAEREAIRTTVSNIARMIVHE